MGGSSWDRWAIIAENDRDKKGDISGRRDQVIIATKFGCLVDKDAKRVAFYDNDPNSNAVAEHVRRDCERSLRRGPLARGILTGKYTADATFSQTDLRGGESFRETWLVPTLEKLGRIREMLTSDGRTLPQGALAWIWARNERTIPIPGMRTVAQVKENAAAM